MDVELIEQGVQFILSGLEVDPSDHNFSETPQRFARAMQEIFAPHNGLPTSFEETYTEFILVRGHEMYTLCPHHLLPVRMVVSLAYMPMKRVLGLSKLIRIMQEVNSGPIMQERFTHDVLNRLSTALEGSYHGAAILVEGWHGCMAIRGVKSNATSITMACDRRFEADRGVMDRFLTLCRR